MSMKTSNEKTWNWKQANGSTLKVVSNPSKGTITVYNSEGQVVLEKKNLSPEQMKIIEQHFLKVVTKKKQTYTKNTPKFDPMIS
ncbi:MAG: hypothetical protein KGY50_04325 [Candidatus Thermoplasmatota archaeon]|nr:hypothetical protein [Candidatus Thermoplasmatota archaeon]